MRLLGNGGSADLEFEAPADRSSGNRVDHLTLGPHATVREAMQAIEAGGAGVALVCDAERHLLAVVTDGDVRRALLAGRGLESTVTDLQTPPPVFASIATPAPSLAKLFTERVRAIPLVDAEQRVIDLAVFDRRAHLPIARPLLGEKELMYVTECVLTGWVSSSGQFVDRFEGLFAEFCDVPHAIATANGTVALHLALLALGIGPGDEVVVPTLSFIASANAVTYTGARPVFVDVDPTTWTLDLEAVERAITPRTRAVMAVHLYGHPAEMDRLQAICKRHDLRLVEDAAEAHGARYQGRVVGSFGDIAAFSFYGNKIVTTGEGGMLVTADAELAERIRVLRDHGMSPDRRYWHPVLGYNYRMTNLQAALGVAQMERIDAILAAKRRIAREYDAALQGIRGLSLPREAGPAESVFWLYSVIIEDEFAISRDEVMAALRGKGVETRPVFPAMHKQPIYDSGQSLPVAEFISDHGISLPSDPTLTASEVERVAVAIRDASSGIR